MRETRQSGSEGGAAQAVPTPIHVCISRDTGVLPVSRHFGARGMLVAEKEGFYSGDYAVDKSGGVVCFIRLRRGS